MNNSVKNGWGEVIGYRCWTCNGVFQSMWRETCNGCRKKSDDAESLRAEVRRLTEAVQSLKNQQPQTICNT